MGQKRKKKSFMGQLEVDHERGVIYFHSLRGKTILRICSLPKPIPDLVPVENFLDITHMVGCSWGNIDEEPE